ncbi:MAG: hypothetical protein WDW38_008898 [Sanguina aurantia]
MPGAGEASSSRTSGCGTSRCSHSSSVVRSNQPASLSSKRSVACSATLDDPQLQVLVKRMEDTRPDMTNRNRTRLNKTLQMIDDINSNDPQKSDVNGVPAPYRLVYSSWVSKWVTALDPNGPDELFILARGKNVEGWKLSEIRRDDYAHNSGGNKQWKMDRKKWLANRCTGIMKEAGYGEASTAIVYDVMMEKDLPDPNDMRYFDLVASFGQINYRKLELVQMVQTLRDADALVFLEHSFPRAFDQLPIDEVLGLANVELRAISQRCMKAALDLPWTPVQQKLLLKAFPRPKAYGELMKQIEGASAGSTHPGDWRYSTFNDYE